MSNGLIMKYFVLKSNGDNAYARASRQALQAYANAIEKENPELSDDLMSWIHDCIDENINAKGEIGAK